MVATVVSSSTPRLDAAVVELRDSLSYLDPCLGHVGDCVSLSCSCGGFAARAAVGDALDGARACGVAVSEARDQLVAALVALNPFMQHQRSCSFRPGSVSPDGDFCSCRLADRKARARTALSRLLELAPKPSEPVAGLAEPVSTSPRRRFRLRDAR